MEERTLGVARCQVRSQMASESGHPDGTGDPAQVKGLRMDATRSRAEGAGLDAQTDVLRDVDGSGQIRSQQREHELIAAVAGADAGRVRDHLVKQLSDFMQDLTTGEVSMRVVDVLEEIKIQKTPLVICQLNN